MKYRNTGNGIIWTFVKISFLSMSVICQIWKARHMPIHVGYVTFAVGREHQITHANVDIELNGV